MLLLTPRRPGLCTTGRHRAQVCFARMHAMQKWYAPRAVQLHPRWGTIRLRQPTHTYAPWGVRGDGLAKSRKRPTREKLRFFTCMGRFELAFQVKQELRRQEDASQALSRWALLRRSVGSTAAFARRAKDAAANLARMEALRKAEEVRDCS